MFVHEFNSAHPIIKFAAFIQYLKAQSSTAGSRVKIIFLLFIFIRHSYSQHHQNAFILVVYRIGRGDLFPKEKLNQFLQGIVFKISQNDT